MTTTLDSSRAPLAEDFSALGCQNCGWEPAAGALWPSHGQIAVRWIEENCICGEGDFYGQLVKLRRDQKRFVYRWYEYCPACEYWHFDEGIRTAATGDGKTTFIASLAALEMAGPPEVAPASPNIVISAASYLQANLLFSVTATMFGGRDQKDHMAPLCGLFEVYEKKITRSDGSPGLVERVAAVAGTNEGGLPSLFIGDELHEWGDKGSNKARVYTVIGKSTKKRRLRYEIPDENGTVRVVFRGAGRILGLSTAGFDIDHSLFGAMIKHAMAAERTPELAPKLLFDHYQAPDGLDYELPEHRRIAVIAASPAAGILWDVQARVDEWGKPHMPKHEWLRYYANVWADIAEESWLAEHPGAWAACRSIWTLEGDEPAVLSIDMALKRDSVAVAEIRMLPATEEHPDGRFAVTAKIWYPANGVLRHRDVFDYIETRAGELGLAFQGLVYDPRYFQLPAEDLEEEGQLVIQFDQSPNRMSPAVGLTYDLILAGGILHDGDPELGSQVKAAVKREWDRGFTLSKGKSRRHIDACVAMCMGVWTLAELAGHGEPSVLDQIW